MGNQSTVSGRELIAYLDRQVRGGHLNAGTASSRRSAVREVLQVAFGDEWETAMFESGRVAALLDEFAEARRDAFTKESIRSYQSNFRRTVELSLDRGAPESGDVDWLTHRFPIRDGVVIDFTLPVDLTPTEARRLSALITALPVEGQ